MSHHHISHAIGFLCQDLHLPAESVELALKQSKANYGTLPIVLWQYGLVSLSELDQIFDWFESYNY